MSLQRKVLWAVGAVVGAALMMWVAVMVDAHEDRPRTMYDDVLRMAELQTRALKLGEAVEPVQVHPRQHVEVAGKRFHAARGIRIRVITHGDGGYCVRGWNQFGQSTRWMCGDADNTP